MPQNLFTVSYIYWYQLQKYENIYWNAYMCFEVVREWSKNITLTFSHHGCLFFETEFLSPREHKNSFVATKTERHTYRAVFWCLKISRKRTFTSFALLPCSWGGFYWTFLEQQWKSRMTLSLLWKMQNQKLINLICLHWLPVTNLKTLFFVWN